VSEGVYAVAVQSYNAYLHEQHRRRYFMQIAAGRGPAWPDAQPHLPPAAAQAWVALAEGLIARRIHPVSFIHGVGELVQTRRIDRRLPAAGRLIHMIGEYERYARRARANAAGVLLMQRQMLKRAIEQSVREGLSPEQALADLYFDPGPDDTPYDPDDPFDMEIEHEPYGELSPLIVHCVLSYGAGRLNSPRLAALAEQTFADAAAYFMIDPDANTAAWAGVLLPGFRQRAVSTVI
jgi:hypothetical protein